ncbi:DUF4258 domain-containing protein [Virgibacillus halodenitrificans]|uniref:DUF4258 domain-containing protein n=1 Tax=Virgibacillus halodenitrificans TaxID=1482 RepID=UPI000EF49886|nr:DUF4258 domain-containing protein [Virgibacillus halodenitrificans]
MTTDKVLVVLKKSHELNKLKQAVTGEKGAIIAGRHTKERYSTRGYFENDISSCLLTGEIVEIKEGYNSRYKKTCRNLTVEGVDEDGNYIICIFSEISKRKNIYNVVTLMPPCDRKRFGKLVA